MAKIQLLNKKIIFYQTFGVNSLPVYINQQIKIRLNLGSLLQQTLKMSGEIGEFEGIIANIFHGNTDDCHTVQKRRSRDFDRYHHHGPNIRLRNVCSYHTITSTITTISVTKYTLKRCVQRTGIFKGLSIFLVALRPYTK